jgi:hypothetical protein
MVFCLLVLPPLFVGVLSIGDLCRGKKPRLFTPDPDGVELLANKGRRDLNSADE